MGSLIDLAMAVGRIAFLDLNHVRLNGYEAKKSDLVIDSMVRALDAGYSDFPVVLVYQTSDRCYELDYDGHRRSVSHFIASKPLKCLIMGKRSAKHSFDIRDTILEDDFKMPEHMRYSYVKSIIPAYW